MIPAGYLYKKVASNPDGLAVPEVYSVSGCISEEFADYIGWWRHNGHWLFDSPEIMEALAAEHAIDLAGLRLFYYEVYEQQYLEVEKRWETFEPEASFATAVQPPAAKRLEGYDVVTFYVRTSPECSPLSCNWLAGRIPVNDKCLLDSLDTAKRTLEEGLFDDSEPGPFRIFAVYTVLP